MVPNKEVNFISLNIFYYGGRYLIAIHEEKKKAKST